MNTARLTIPGFNRQVSLFLGHSALYHIGLLGIADVVLNFYFVSLGHGSETIGILQALPRLSGLLTGLPIGLVAYRLGARRILIVSTVGVALTFPLLVIWPSLWLLGISRFLLGMFYGAGQIATSPLMVTLTDTEHETQFFSYHNVTSMGMSAFGSVIGGFLPALMVSLFPFAIQGASVPGEQTPFAYGAALVICGIITLISIIPLFWLDTPEADKAAERAKRQQIAIPWRRLAVLSSPLLVFGFTGGLTFPFYNLFFRQTFALPDQTVGMIMSLGWLGMALVPMANPWWERRFGRAWALGIMLTIAAIAFWGLSLAETLLFGVITYAIAISFRNVMQTLYQPLIMDALPPELRNIASSIGLVLWNIGWFTATALSGFWQTTYGFGFIMRLVAIGVMITAISVVVIFRQREPQHNQNRNIMG
jgi:MFS family permease